MTPATWIPILLAALAIVAALSLAVSWLIEPGDPRSEDPARRGIRFRFQWFYRWAADNGPIGIGIAVLMFVTTYLCLCLTAVMTIRLIPGLAP